MNAVAKIFMAKTIFAKANKLSKSLKKWKQKKLSTKLNNMFKKVSKHKKYTRNKKTLEKDFFNNLVENNSLEYQPTTSTPKNTLSEGENKKQCNCGGKKKSKTIKLKKENRRNV